MTQELRADVLVVGAGGAGLYAAIEAKRRGVDVLLVDKSMIGRGGATIMAQMTVAAAIGHAEPDSWDLHLQDTLAGGKGISNEVLAERLCREGPERVFEAWRFGVPWAADGDRIRLVTAPGHSRRRCCYVDGLATGTGVITGLMKEARRLDVRRRSGVFVTDLVKGGDGHLAGAAGFDVDSGEPVALWAPAVVLAGGGLTELFARNSGSVNLTGDPQALALKAGAELVDMEMMQFFPIAHLAPRLIGLDPIMWDPFRYKLGGRLLNGRGEEFLERYAGVADQGTYTATRDVATYGILKEVEAGRGTSHGGAWLDFRGIPAETIHAAFPTAVDRLLAQGIDLTQRAVEVAPMAHYMIGGIRVDGEMATCVPGLSAAGEAVGGAHGGNRLSGNGITEALVFGHRAGVTAAREARARAQVEPDAAATATMAAAHAHATGIRGRCPDSDVFLPALRSELQQVMWKTVGPLRDAAGLAEARVAIARLRDERWPAARVGASRAYNLEWVEWHELGNMLLGAEAVRRSAEMRRESRGAHQREDYPGPDPAFERNIVVRLDGAGELETRLVPVTRRRAGAAGGR